MSRSWAYLVSSVQMCTVITLLSRLLALASVQTKRLLCIEVWHEFLSTITSQGALPEDLISYPAFMACAENAREQT